MNQSGLHPHTIALHRIDIATPCTASWDKMAGNERVRHCGHCNKNVSNLSAMPEAEAAALLADDHSDNLCVRFYRRPNGTVMTSDCGAKARAGTRQAWRKLPGMALLALSVAGCADGMASTPMASKDAPLAVSPVSDNNAHPAPAGQAIEQTPTVVPAAAPPSHHGETFRPTQGSGQSQEQRG